MKNRRKTVFGAALLFCLCSVCGCSFAPETQTEEKIELELMVHKREDVESMGKLVDAFNRSQDRIQVRETIAPDVDTELRIRAVKGELPDLVQLNGLQAKECMEYVEGGYLMDLTGQAFLENVRQELLPYVSYDGKIPLFPMTLSYEGIFVNLDKLSQDGYELPATYEELLATAEKIQEDGGTPFLFADEDNWSVRLSLEAIETALGGSQAEFWEQVALGQAKFQSDRQTLEAVERMIELRQYGQEDALETGYDEAVERFAAGEAYFFPQGSWCYQALLRKNPKLRLSLLPFPVREGEEPHVSFWIDSNLAITSQSEHPQEAAEFLAFVSLPENMALYTEAQQAFGCADGLEQEIPYADAVLGCLEQGTACCEAVGLPQAVSRFRDENIRKLLIDPGSGAVQEYLEECTRLLREYAKEYLTMKEKTG